MSDSPTTGIPPLAALIVAGPVGAYLLIRLIPGQGLLMATTWGVAVTAVIAGGLGTALVLTRR